MSQFFIGDRVEEDTPDLMDSDRTPRRGVIIAIGYERFDIKFGSGYIKNYVPMLKVRLDYPDHNAKSDEDTLVMTIIANDVKKV